MMHWGCFDTTRNGNHSSYPTPTPVGGRCPLGCKIFAESDPPPFEKRRLRPISADNVSTVRDSEKSSIMTNIKQCWQVSASTGLNLGLNQFKPSWQKQVSTTVSATLAETGFCRSFWASFYPKLLVYIWKQSCNLCSVLFDFVQYAAIRILLPSIALQ